MWSRKLSRSSLDEIFKISRNLLTRSNGQTLIVRIGAPPGCYSIDVSFPPPPSNSSFAILLEYRKNDVGIDVSCFVITMVSQPFDSEIVVHGVTELRIVIPRVSIEHQHKVQQRLDQFDYPNQTDAASDSSECHHDARKKTRECAGYHTDGVHANTQTDQRPRRIARQIAADKRNVRLKVA